MDFLPAPIAAALRGTLDPRTPSVWRRLLKDAHDLAALPPGENKDGFSPIRSPLATRPRASASLPRTSDLMPFFKPLHFLPIAPYLHRPAAVLSS